MNGANIDVRKMPRINIITGCVLIIVGLTAIFWLIPFHIAHQDVDQYVNSPKFFPYVMSIILTLLAALFLIQNIFKLKNLKKIVHEQSEENESLGFGWHETINLGIFAVGSAAYLFLMDKTGFIVSSIVLLAVSMYFSRVNKLWLVITSVGIPILIQQLLWHTLSISLP